MNKAELYEKLSTETGVPKKDVEAVMEGFVKITTETLKSGEEVTLTSFGTFMAKKRDARMGVNPQKPSEKIQIPTVTIPKFKAGKGLKDALKESPGPATTETKEDAATGTKSEPPQEETTAGGQPTT